MIAYIDESGAHGFDFSHAGTSTHFVITSILIAEEKHQEVAQLFTEIKNKYYPNSELKSSKIAGQEQRRRAILDSLKSLDFKVYSLIVDKKKIHKNSGLQYKESFYKFLYGILYTKLFTTFQDIDIYADKMISAEFIDSFKRYIRENHQVDLFRQNNIEFGNSAETVLLQLSDLIGGSISRYCSGKSPLNPLELLKDKVLGHYFWPEKHNSYIADTHDSSEFEKEISELAMLRVNAYVNSNIDTQDRIVRLRVMFLYYLKSVFQYESRQRFIFSREIMNHLEKNTGENINEQFLRQEIVGPLRSEGVLIVSNVQGYKIPSTENDIITFFNLFSRIITPMVKRLEKSHQALFEATNGRLDILKYPEFEYLKKLMNK